MKIAFVADVHLGNHAKHGGPLVGGLNLRCRLVLGALEAARKLATAEDCSHLVVCGDLFDTARPEPQVVAAAQYVFAAKGPMPTEPEVIVIKGNHDIVTDEQGDHALGPLRPVATVPEGPTAIPLWKGTKVGPRLWAVPFQAGPSSGWFSAALEKLAAEDTGAGPRILALHLGIRDERTAPWLREATDAIGVEELAALMERHRIEWAFAGNWHDPRKWEMVDGGAVGTRHVVQVGCLAPTGWDNPGLAYGTMAVLDTESKRPPKIIRVPGPRFVASAEEARLAASDGCTPFVRLKGGGAEGEAEAAQNAGAVAVEVGPADASEAQAALRTAAALARSADNVEEALAAYVGQLPVDPDLRPKVLERCRRYLAGGGR